MIQTLQNEFWHLEIDPTVGASIASLRAKIGSEFQDLMRRTPESVRAGNSASPFSSFTLAPFSNRIRGAKFSFEGREYQLRATASDGSTQHGDVRNRPWRVQVVDQSLVCRFDSTDFSDFNFPFPIRMKLTYQLTENALDMQLEMENTGNSRMPAGYGFHPYFVRNLAGHDLRLQFKAEGIYQTDSSFIPTQGRQPIGSEYDFSNSRELGDLAINHVYGGWNGTARLEYQNITLKLQASEIFSHLCVYAAPDGTLAVEPISHCTDGFNLMARGVQNTGVRVLEPGHGLSGWVRLSLEG
jgi:aldose 1-epimerase